MDVIEQLQQLGFSQYEAQAYVALLQENPLNGYELAKASGVPRANIYRVLQKLEEAGAVMRLTAEEGTRYAPVPAEELLMKQKRRFEQTIETASAGLQQIASPPQLESVLNVRGYSALLDQAETLLSQTKQHLLLSVWPEEAMALAAPMQQAADRGVNITTLCLRGCPEPCPACRGSVFRYALAPVRDTRWLVVVSDEDELVAGEIHSPAGSESPAGESTSVRTRQRMLVNLTSSYIQNSIALATILTHFGKRLNDELDVETLAALNRLRPLDNQGTWLETMQQMLRLEQPGE